MDANVSSYIAAGNIAARQTSGIQAAAIRSGADYSKVTQEAQKQRIQSEIAARKASAGVVEAGIRGQTLLKGTEMMLDADKREAEAAKSRRKAGAVAAAGVLAGDAIAMNSESRNKKERAKAPDMDFAGRLQAINKQIEESDATLLSLSKPLLPDNEKVATGQDSGISSPGVQKQALLDTISFAEGTWDDVNKQIKYNIAFGGGSFDNNQPHPDRVIKSPRVSSAAHGAFQFMPGTWRGINNGQNLPMTAANQNAAAIRLAERRGYDFNKPFDSQSHLLAGEWASFPTAQGRSQYNLADGSPQPSKAADVLKEFYNERVRALSGSN